MKPLAILRPRYFRHATLSLALSLVGCASQRTLAPEFFQAHRNALISDRIGLITNACISLQTVSNRSLLPRESTQHALAMRNGLRRYLTSMGYQVGRGLTPMVCGGTHWEDRRWSSLYQSEDHTHQPLTRWPLLTEDGQMMPRDAVWSYAELLAAVHKVGATRDLARSESPEPVLLAIDELTIDSVRQFSNARYLWIAHYEKETMSTGNVLLIALTLYAISALGSDGWATPQWEYSTYQPGTYSVSLVDLDRGVLLWKTITEREHTGSGMNHQENDFAHEMWAQHMLAPMMAGQ